MADVHGGRRGAVADPDLEAVDAARPERAASSGLRGNSGAHRVPQSVDRSSSSRRSTLSYSDVSQ